MYVIDFTPPMDNLKGSFNTVRLGRKWSQLLKGGETVLLIDTKAKMLIGYAEVTKVAVGRFTDIAFDHAHKNHNHKGKGKLEAMDDMQANMTKRYGPHIFSDTKIVTFIYLKVKREVRKT